MEFGAEEWGRKGATLSDKTARSQYGLTQEEIYAANSPSKPIVRRDRLTHLLNPGRAGHPTACAASSPPYFPHGPERSGFLAR